MRRVSRRQFVRAAAAAMTLGAPSPLPERRAVSPKRSALLLSLQASCCLLFPPPTLSECRHRSLARCLITVRGRVVFVVAVGQRPLPRCAYWRGDAFDDAAHHHAISKHVVVVVVPVT